jgi:hypothetical protein
MVEVFKTNVTEHTDAKMLVTEIHARFVDYYANFDLDDCDNVLRIKCTSGSVPSDPLIALLKQFGFEAEVLPDEIMVYSL